MESIKDLLNYILNGFKFWVVVQPWERGIRVRFGKNQKLIKPGIHFRIPLFDSVYIQCVRLRVIPLPMQTLTSKDFKNVTLNGCIGYEISDLEVLYNKMLYPEQTIANMVMGKIADYIFSCNMLEVLPDVIAQLVISKTDFVDYGLNIKYFKITSFAVVKTYRLIQDHSWVQDGIKLTEVHS